MTSHAIAKPGRWALGMGTAAAMAAALIVPIASSASAATTQPPSSQALTTGAIAFPPTGAHLYTQALSECLNVATPWNKLVQEGVLTSVAHCTTLYSMPTSPSGPWVSWLTIGFFLFGANSSNTVTPPY
jgi:hypothetical protein